MKLKAPANSAASLKEKLETVFLLPVGVTLNKNPKATYKGANGGTTTGKYEVLDDNYNNSGRQLVKVEWPDEKVVNKGQELEAQLDVTITDQAPSLMKFDVFGYTGTKNVKVPTYTNNVFTNTVLEEDTEDLNGNNNATEQRFKAGNIYYLIGQYDLQTKKEVKGAKQKEYNLFTTVRPGEKVDYRLSMTNTTKKDLGSMVLIDVLPSVNDLGITDNIQRGSQFNLTLDSKGIAVPKEWKDKVDIYYSTSENPKRDDLTKHTKGSFKLGNPEGAQDPAWKHEKDMTDEDWAQVKSFKIEMKKNENWIKGADIDITYSMHVPTEDQLSDDLQTCTTAPETRAAWNSFAVATDYGQPVEPERVGVAIECLGEIDAEKKVNKEKVNRGDIVTYEIEVTNTKENSEVKNVVVKDVLPAGLALVPGTVKVDSEDVPVTVDQNTFEVTIPQIKGLDTVTVSFDAKVLQDAATGEIMNIAEVTNPDKPEDPKKPQVPVVVNPLGDIETKKLVNKEKAKVGETVSYTIEVKNIVEDSLLKDVIVSDELPQGLVLKPETVKVDGKTVSLQLSDNGFTVKIPALKGGQTSNITFDANVALDAQPGEIMNIAKVTNPDKPEEPPHEPKVPITVDPLGEIVAEKVVNKDKVKPGETLTYTINVKNTVEGSSLEKVKVSDELPEGLTLVPGTVKVNDQNAIIDEKDNGFEVIISKLPGGNVATITFEAEVSKDIDVEKVINVAEVTNPDKPKEPVKPEVPTTIEPLGELEAEKLVNKDKVKPGETLTYTVKVTNTVKDSKVENAVLVSDKLPAGMTLVKDSVKLDGKPIEVEYIGNDAFKYTVEQLKGLETVELTFDAFVQKDIQVGKVINVAEVSNPDKPDEPPLTPSVPTVVEPLGDIETEKKVSEELVRPGDTLTYTIVVKNIVGGSVLKNIPVSDELPEGLVLQPATVKVDGQSSSLQLTENGFTIYIPELKGNEVSEVTFDAKVALDAKAGEIVNIANVVNPDDPDKPHKPQVPTVVEHAGEIVAEKVASADKVKPGETFTYTINVKNIVKDSKLQEVTVSDELPEGLKLDAATIRLNGEATKAKAEDNKFTLTIPELKGHETATITFDALVLENADAGMVKNTAVITNPEKPNEPEKPSVPTTIEPIGELAAEKLINKDKVKPGEEVTYTIKVTNTVEDSIVKNAALVADQLPPGMTLVKDSVKLNDEAIDVKYIGNNAFEYEIPALKGEETATLTFDALVAKDVQPGTLTNVAIITNPEKPEEPPIRPEVPTTVEPLGEIETVKEVSKDKVKPGETFTYTIKVTNTVEGSILKRVSDELPEGVKLEAGTIKVNGETATVTPNGNMFEIELLDLKGLETAEITFEATVDEDVEAGTLVNVAEVENPNDPDKPFKPQVPVTVDPIGEIEAVKKINKEKVRPGEKVTYTIEG